MHLGAIGLLVVGQYLLIGGEVGLGSGEAMIFAATLLRAAEVILAKRLLSGLSALTVGTARKGIGVMVLIGYGAASGALADLGALGVSHWGWVLLTGAVLAGYVATWYSAPALR